MSSVHGGTIWALPSRSRFVGGDKSGKDHWYDAFVPLADRLYDKHLAALRRKD